MSQSLSIDGNAITSLSSSTLRSKLAPIVLPSNHPRARFSNWAKTFDCLPGLGEIDLVVPPLNRLIVLHSQSSCQHPSRTSYTSSPSHIDPPSSSEQQEQAILPPISHASIPNSIVGPRKDADSQMKKKLSIGGSKRMEGGWSGWIS